MVWQARMGSIFHAVGSTLGQDWRQETKKLLMPAILHGIESLGWDELESVQGLQGGLLSAQRRPSCWSGLPAMALLSSFHSACL